MLNRTILRRSISRRHLSIVPAPARPYFGLIDIVGERFSVGLTIYNQAITDDDSEVRTVTAEEILPRQGCTSELATERTSSDLSALATSTNSGDYSISAGGHLVALGVTANWLVSRSGQRICIVNSNFLNVMRINWVNFKDLFLGRLQFGSSDTFLSVKE